MPMPPKLSDPVSERRRRAADYGRRAGTAIEIERYLEMDRRWVFRARSREYAERVGGFIASRPRGGKSE
jgi:hypothetical protein